jgi:hypothetical protein
LELRAENDGFKYRLAKKVGMYGLLPLLFTGAASIAQERPKEMDRGGVRCDRPALKKVIIDALNTSSEFQERKIQIVDYQSDRTISTDPSKNSISCHAIMVIANGQKFAGVLTIAAPGDKTDIHWYDDDAENGLTKVGISAVPADELRFIEALIKARNAYEEARTDFAKGAIRPQRAKAICGTLKSTQANNWIGKLVRLTTNGDGKGVVAIEIAPGIVIKTFSTSLSDAASDTLIEPESKLYSALGELSQGDRVKFSGAFFARSTDCILEGSLTMNGSLTSPEFIMRFANVQKAPF